MAHAFCFWGGRLLINLVHCGKVRVSIRKLIYNKKGLCMAKNRELKPFIVESKIFKKHGESTINDVVKAIECACAINTGLSNAYLMNAYSLHLAFLNIEDSYLSEWEDHGVMINFVEDFTNHYEHKAKSVNEVWLAYHRYELYVRCSRGGALPLTMFDIPEGTGSPLERITQYARDMGEHYLCYTKELTRLSEFASYVDKDGKRYVGLWGSVNDICAYINKRVRNPIESVTGYSSVKSSLLRHDQYVIKSQEKRKNSRPRKAHE